MDVPSRRPVALRSADDRVRLEVAGGRVVERAGFEEVIPNMSRADLSRIQFGTLPHEPSLEPLVHGLYPMDSPAAKRFFDTRKIVKRQLADGTFVASVTSNVWEKLTAPPYLAPPEGERWVAGKDQVRTYDLAAMLTDVYLLDKFQLSAKQISTARTMAVANATAAATYLQTLVRAQDGFSKYVVTAGRYSMTRKWAKASLASMSADLSLVPTQITSLIIGDSLFMYGPGEESRRWSVFGPLWYATELKQLYAIVAQAGPAQACFALGIELTLLGLDITDAGVVMSPAVNMHTGPQDNLPMHSSAVTQEILSAAGRAKLARFAGSINPVHVDGQQVACAVRVSRSRVLVNTHVLEAGEHLQAASRDLTPDRMVSKDLWVARADCDSFEFDWILRSPVVGEQVIVCYLRGDQMQYTAPVSVRASDGVTLVMSLTSDLRSGMSGGAIVALHDMALLGVYSGSGAQQALGAIFSQEHYTDMCTADAASDASRLSATATEGSLYDSFKARGLGRVFDRVIESLQPMYDGLQHVGMGYQIGHEFRTTCDVESAPLTVGTSKRNLVFDSKVNDVYTAHDTSSIPGPAVLRRAQYGEKVFVVGRDINGPYTTDPVRVRHIGVAGRTFFITDSSDVGDLPLRGGLVLGCSDGAVVGQYSDESVSQSMGCVARCIAVDPPLESPRLGESETVVEWLAKTFPMLNPGTWPPELLEEVFTHSSVSRYEDPERLFNHGNAPLAYVGDAVAKIQIGLSLRAAGVPSPQWQRHIQERQTDRNMASIAERFGLSKWLKLGRGVSLAPGSKAYAGVLEALLAAIYLRETSATVNEFCLAVELTAREYVDVTHGPVKEAVGKIERRLSSDAGG